MARTERRAARVRSLALPLRAFARRQNGHISPPEVQVEPDSRQEIAFGDLRWIDIRHPTRADMDDLGREFDFHPLALDDCLSRVQRPKVDDYETYLFIVMHFPRFNRVERVAEAKEVDFFLGPDYVITVHKGELPPLLRFWARLEDDENARQQYMSGGPQLLLYHIVDRLTDYLFPIMTRIDQNLDTLDDRIFRPDARKAVRDLAAYRRDLISLRRIIRPDMLVVSTLENGRASLLEEEMAPYWGDISDHFARVWEMLVEFKDEVEGMDDTFNTLYSYRTNETLRALTIISVMLLPLTLISGIYGMNVKLPFQEHLHAFSMVTGSMLLVVVVLLTFFRRKDWL